MRDLCANATALAHHQCRQGATAMNNTATIAQTAANAYQRALARETFERSDMYQDPNSPFWRSSFDALVKILLQRLGLGAYHVWYDDHFPDDDGVTYTYHAKCAAVEAALKAQAQP